MELSKLIISKTTDVEYPGLDGFVVSVTHLPRDELLKLRKKATTTKFNKRTRAPEEEVDSDLFQELYIKAVIKDWTGLKYKYLNKLLLIDLNQINDVEDELEYTASNAIALMKNSSEFDAFISDIVEDLSNFTQAS